MLITDIEATCLRSLTYINYICTWKDKMQFCGVPSGSPRECLAAQTIAWYIVMKTIISNRISCPFPVQHLSKRTHETREQQEI